MGKSDALIYAPGQVGPGMEVAHTHKGAHRVGMYVAGHQEGKENRALLLYRNGIRPPVHLLIDIPSCFLQLRLQLRQKILDKPLVIASAGGTAFFNQIVSGQAEKGIHHYLAVHHRPGTDILVDAPGARDHADIFLVHHVYRQGAGVDIKRAARHLGSGQQTGFFRGLRGDLAADLRRAAQGRQLFHAVGKAEQR